ncbi:MAG: protein kinase [Planctomycetales bacterium]|nr:protein kinase [Planctomycetales bacterium]
MASDQNIQDLTGRELGDYQILRRLGRGGMAEVYLAEQRSLGRKVAVKVLRSELAADNSYVKRFQNEARSVAALVHANIVQVYEVGCVDGIHFIAQEYVQGQNVKQLVDRNGPLSAAQTVSILRQVAAALHRAGQEKMVHRDIKPENILLTPTGEAKVADFGLARTMSAEQAEMTQAGITMGTPLYMSPEQVEGKSLDGRSDLYSCGATAFFMLMGEPPFHGETPLGIAVQHLQNEPPSLYELRSDIPDALCDIVHKMLQKKPDQRYAHAAELLKELRSLKIAGMDDLPLEFETLVTMTSEETHANVLNATTRLQTIMETQALPSVVGKRGWLILAGLLTACVVGVSLAELTWSGPLLQITDDQSNSVEKKASAKEQYAHAVFLLTEEGWLSVERFFPAKESADNKYWGNRAKQQLGYLYLNSDQLPQALQVFQDLENLEATEQEFQAVGLAGQVMVFSLQNKQTQLKQKLEKLWPLRNLLDAEAREEIESTADKLGVRQALDVT